MKEQHRIRQLLVALAAVLALSGCMETRPVSGEVSDGAGRVRSNGEDAAVLASGITVCVDAGHGFDDIGTSSAYLGETMEKDITLNIALHLKEALETAGITVILTHDGETFPRTSEDDGNNLFNPQERIAYADTLEIDYYFSIHCDSYAADSSVNGTRIYCSKGTKYTKKSAEAAEKIRDAVNAAYPDAKETVVREMAKNEAYYVIREADVPSALIEVGFVTSPTDAANMLDDSWRKGIAGAISDGIVRFFTE